MKKLLSCTFAFAMLFGVAGCNKDEEKEEEEKPLTFAEYLEASESLTVSKLNETVGPISFEMNGYLTQLDIQNTKMSLTQGTETVSYYMWSGTEGTGEDAQNYVYGAMPGETANEYMAAKINLDTMDEFIDGVKEGVLSNSPISVDNLLVDTDESGSVEFSEVIDNALALTGAVDVEQVNVENVLSKLKFDINDFEDKGNGVYKLKLSSLVDIAKEIAGEELPEDAEDKIAALDEMLQIEVKYGEEHINEVKMSINVVDDEEETYSSTQNTTMTLGFEYSEDKISKTTLSVVNNSVDTFVEESESVTTTSYSAMNLVYGANELSISFETGETALNINGKTAMSILEDNEKITVEFDVFSKGETEAQDTNANIELEIIGNWLSSLNATMPGFTIAVESNVNVVIPADIKALEAEDMTDTVLGIIANAMNPGDGSEDVA